VDVAAAQQHVLFRSVTIWTAECQTRYKPIITAIISLTMDSVLMQNGTALVNNRSERVNGQRRKCVIHGKGKNNKNKNLHKMKRDFTVAIQNTKPCSLVAVANFKNTHTIPQGRSGERGGGCRCAAALGTGSAELSLTQYSNRL
jgi:hypothetical protein